MAKRDTRDLIGGVLLIALGLFAAYYAQRYEFGTLNRMGPGYFPVALGLILAALGVLVALPALFRPGEPIEVRYKTCAIVIGAVVIFGATLKPLGIVFATALAVFVASLADNDITWRGRGMISVAIAAVTYLVFIYGLSMVLPVWPWSP